MVPFTSTSEVCAGIGSLPWPLPNQRPGVCDAIDCGLCTLPIGSFILGLFQAECYPSFQLGATVFEGYNDTNCEKMPDDYYIAVPGGFGTDVRTYICNNLSNIVIVKIENSVITEIGSCNC
jgi:hypothetical protein